MVLKPVVPGVYAISLGVVNAFLIDTDHLTLIDTGLPGSAGRILEAVAALGRRPKDVRHLLVTHCHIDHAGSLAVLKQATGASVSMHAADAALVKIGQAGRPMIPGPGVINRLVFRRFMTGPPSRITPAEIEHEVTTEDTLPAAGGIQAIHTPGHCAGHLVFLWPHHGGVLFAGDAAAHIVGLGLSAGYEDLAEGRRSLARVAAQPFAVACFGHGRPILRDAATRFRQKWGTPAA
jgi:glyoxylase-like metal-dependent hydrolase (beta-lactamase superfamily II)